MVEGFQGSGFRELGCFRVLGSECMRLVQGPYDSGCMF